MDTVNFKYSKTAYVDLLQKGNDGAINTVKDKSERERFWFHGNPIDNKKYEEYVPPADKAHLIIFRSLRGALAGIPLTIFHLGQAIILGSYHGVVSGNADYLVTKTFSVLRDLEDIMGSAAAATWIFRKWGCFHLQQAKFHKECYDYHLAYNQTPKAVLQKRIKRFIIGDSIYHYQVLDIIRKIKDPNLKNEIIKWVARNYGDRIQIHIILSDIIGNIDEASFILFCTEATMSDENIKDVIDRMHYQYWDKTLDPKWLTLIAKMFAKLKDDEIRNSCVEKCITKQCDLVATGCTDDLKVYLEEIQKFACKETASKCHCQVIKTIEGYIPEREKFQKNISALIVLANKFPPISN